MILEFNPSIATISIFPDRDQTHLGLSALAGYTKSLLKSLNIDDKKRHLVLANQLNSHTEQYLDNDIIVYRCWRKGSPLYLWDLFCALKKFPSLKIVHLQHEFNQFGGLFTVALIPVLCFLIRYLMGKTLVLTVHEVLDPNKFTSEFMQKNFIHFHSTLAKVLLKLYYKTLAHSAHLILVHSDDAKNLLQLSIKIKTTVAVIPHGVENKTELLSGVEARRRLNISPTKKVVLFFGMMDRRKGIHLAVEAFKSLNEDYLLLVVGGMSDRLKKNRSYQKWFSELKTQMADSKNIGFEGFVACKEIETYFRAADLILLPYTQSGSSSGVLALSLTYERPVLATQFVRPVLGQNSDLIPDPEKIKSSIEQSFSQDALREVDKNYKQLWDWIRIASRLSRHYESLLTVPLPNKRAALINSEFSFRT